MTPKSLNVLKYLQNVSISWSGFERILRVSYVHITICILHLLTSRYIIRNLGHACLLSLLVLFIQHISVENEVCDA